VRVIPLPFFDRPLWTDPLWWFGIVVGLFVGIAYGLRADLGPEVFAWKVVTSVVGFTWTAGLLLSTVRHHLRRRQLSRGTYRAPRAPNDSEQPSTTPEC